MRLLLMAGLLTCTIACIAQTKIDKTFPLAKGQTIELTFDFPELIRVHTWEKNEVRITGSISINRGEHDQAFQLTSETVGNALRISSEIKDKENIPRRTVIRIGEQEYYFKSADTNDPAIQKFLDEHGHSYTFMNNGIDFDITLEVFIPKGAESLIESKFGLVEVTDFHGPLTVNAIHGGVDVTLSSATTGQITARTKFGEILTNLDTKFNSAGLQDDHDHWTEIQASLGNGPRYEIESKFGKVYLRKPK